MTETGMIITVVLVLIAIVWLTALSFYVVWLGLRIEALPQWVGWNNSIAKVNDEAYQKKHAEYEAHKERVEKELAKRRV